VNLWPRRIITGLGLLLIIALIVWGIVAAVRAIAGAFSAAPVPQSTPQSVVQSGALDASGYTLKGGQEATADGLLTDGTTIDIPACLDRDITATAKASPVASGSAMPVTLTLENRGSVACSTSLTRFNLAVTTGDHQVYDSSRCADSQQSSMTLLLRPGGTEPGIYRVRLDGVDLVRPLPEAEVIEGMTVQKEFARAGAIVSVAANLDEADTWGGAVGYRFTMSRSAALIYSLHLRAVARGLVGTVFAGFATSAVRHLLDSDGVSRHQMFAVTIASPQTEPPYQAAG